MLLGLMDSSDIIGYYLFKSHIHHPVFKDLQ
uniref:Uncharacterized protein n=1 Tax=Anguilla anguilla TaxID=7936 RepID=A0A0E9WQQ6_ANGAN